MKSNVVLVVHVCLHSAFCFMWCEIGRYTRYIAYNLRIFILCHLQIECEMKTTLCFYAISTLQG